MKGRGGTKVEEGMKGKEGMRTVRCVFSYVMLASLVGLYSLPLLRRLRPVRKETSMTKVIGNCTAILVLSSALPVLVRTLGE